MKTYGDLDFQTSNYVQNVKLVLAIETDFPDIPTPGRVLFVNKRVLMCVEIVSGVPVWVPLTQEIDSYIHTQTQASDTWTIEHNLNANTVFIQVVDQYGHSIIPESIDLSQKDIATITFNAPVIGRAIAMLGSLSGLPKEDIIFTQSFASSTTWVVNHGLGYNPNIRCYINGYQVQPYSIVHNSTMTATVTFTSAQTGYVNCL